MIYTKLRPQTASTAQDIQFAESSFTFSRTYRQSIDTVDQNSQTGKYCFPVSFLVLSAILFQITYVKEKTTEFRAPERAFRSDFW